MNKKPQVPDAPDARPLENNEQPVTPGKKRRASRRKFLGAVTAGAITAAVPAAPASAQGAFGRRSACEDDVIFPFGVEPPSHSANRFMKAYKCRAEAAKLARNRSLVHQRNNGDEQAYFNKIGNFTKSLPHNRLGEVDLIAWQTLVRARETQNPYDFEQIQLGLGRKLTSPQAGLAMDLEGPDSHHVAMPPAPALASAEEAGEMTELYWMALARDVHFSDYETSPLTRGAAEDLSRMSDFRGPKERGRVTPATIFRNGAADEINGPWLSQFLIKDFYFGANYFSQKIKTLPAGSDYMTRSDDWLDVQNGADPTSRIVYDDTPRYIRNLRDLAQWVHVDALYQGYLQAALIMMGQGIRLDP
ncbi:MAG: hypothetical protein ACKV2V_23570, partial [Blastocatellia bacterium]